MTYVGLNLVFLGLATAGTLGALLLARRRRSGVTPTWPALAATAVVMVALTAVFDNVIIGVGLVDYDPELHLNIRLGLAPIEDFAYTVAALALMPALWAALHREGS